MRRSRCCAVGVFSVARTSYMRFDEPPGASPPSGLSDGATSTTRPAAVRYKKLPESMLPKRVAPDFTPFPLPKYDTDLEFGPTRLSNIPDVELARQRMHARDRGQRRSATTTTSDSGARVGLPDEALRGVVGSAGATRAVGTDDSGGAPADAAPPAAEADALGGYHVGARFPWVDRLVCDRGLEDLLHQFEQRPQREARTATLLDLASTMHRRSNEELVRMLNTIGAVFAHDGGGLNFLVASVVKFGRPYHVVSELTKAYVHLVDTATEVMVMEQPERLQQSPALFAELLNFLALIKVFEPNRWATKNPNSPQNRADYSHPRGVNQCTAHQRTGENLYDYLVSLVRDGPDGEHSLLLARCTLTQLLDILGGFAGVAPDKKVEGRVAVPLLRACFRIYKTMGYVVSEPADLQQLERLYMLMRLLDIEQDSVLAALLEVDVTTLCNRAGQRTVPLQVRVVPPMVRGPDFFSAVSRERRPVVKARALELLEASLSHAVRHDDADCLLALVESGEELLMSLKDRRLAVEFACRHEFDVRGLRGIPSMSTVAERVGAEAAVRHARIPAELRDTQASLVAAPQQANTHANHFASRYVAFDKHGSPTHPVRTLLSDLDYASSMDNVFILHSSIFTKTADQLVSVVRRLRSGKDALVVTMRCLRALAAKAAHAVSVTESANASQALEILSYELEQGRVVLLPASEELRLHDAGTFNDEDLMLWTVAAYFARELPLVKVHTLMSAKSPARHPHHTLKGEHSVLNSSNSLYERDAPLLQALHSKELRSVTHHVTMQQKVRDRPNTLYRINPNRANMQYRRDKALFDKYHVTARNAIPGFSQGALESDLRGLGFYTPDHPQVPYRPISVIKQVK